MAILHVANLSPTKAELISGWLPLQPWAPEGAEQVDLVGAYRFDDPGGRVGLEIHLVRCAGVLVQVPLTYRDTPLPDAANSVGTMQHSVLGERWVHDGLADPVFVNALAAATLTGCGQAIGMVEHDGRSVVVPPSVHLAGGGWTGEPVPVDGLVQHTDDDHWAVLRNDQFELRWARRPVPGDRPPIGLTATWPGHEGAVVLSEARLRRDQ